MLVLPELSPVQRAAISKYELCDTQPIGAAQKTRSLFSLGLQPMPSLLDRMLLYGSVRPRLEQRGRGSKVDCSRVSERLVTFGGFSVLVLRTSRV